MEHWRARKVVGEYHAPQVLKFPFYTENLMVLGLFTLMFWIAGAWASLPHGMGVRSVAFWFICITLFFNYSFVIVDYTARGAERIPKLSGEMVFPTHDARLYSTAFLTLCALAFVFARWDSNELSFRLLIAFFVYPLIFAVLVVSHDLRTLLNPVHFVTRLKVFVSSINGMKFFVLQAIVGSLLYWEITSFGSVSALHLSWQVPVSLILMFMLFRSLGVLLNSEAQALGLLVLNNAAAHEADLREEQRLQLDDFVQVLYRNVRVHEYGKAWQDILQYQRANGHDGDLNLFRRLTEWQDARLATMLGGQIAESMMRSGDRAAGLKLFREAFALDSSHYRFSSGGAAIAFLDAAQDLPSRQAIVKYWDNFVEHFPNYPAMADVLAHAIDMAIAVGDAAIAQRLLSQLAEKHPERVATEQYQQQNQLLQQGIGKD